YTFLLSSYAPLRAIHSFPTRRSSDLHFAQYNINTAQDNHNVGYVLSQTHILQHGQVDKTGRADAITIGIGRTITNQIEPQFAFGDRKSTRLNSSHLGISYAVFCLKKK